MCCGELGCGCNTDGEFSVGGTIGETSDGEWGA